MISKNSFKKAWNNRKLVGGALKAAHVRPDYHLYEDLFQEGLIVYAEMIEELTPQKDNKEIDKLSFRDDQGRVYDIEMQTTNKHDLEERMQYYAAGLNHFTLKSGQSYKELKSSYVVFFALLILINKVKACTSSISLIVELRQWNSMRICISRSSILKARVAI